VLITFRSSRPISFFLPATVTQIPLETSQNRETPPSSHRPPWIRPVRKKAPSAPRSNYSTDSPPQHSSPESYTAPEFLSSTENSAKSVHSPFSPSTTPHGIPSRPPQFTTSGGDQPMSFLDPTMGIESQLYMSSTDMMGLFDDSVDVQRMFTGGYPMPSLDHQPPPHQGPYDSQGFLKHEGLATSP
jgi:hypothetical protein